MKKWGKLIPVILQAAAVLSLIAAGIAMQKWG